MGKLFCCFNTTDVHFYGMEFLFFLCWVHFYFLVISENIVGEALWLDQIPFQRFSAVWLQGSFINYYDRRNPRGSRGTKNIHVAL